MMLLMLLFLDPRLLRLLECAASVWCLEDEGERWYLWHWVWLFFLSLRLSFLISVSFLLTFAFFLVLFCLHSHSDRYRVISLSIITGVKAFCDSLSEEHIGNSNQ
jgi:hypothetical protein